MSKRTEKKALAKAQWTSAYINKLPDSSFLYIEPGGSKDGEGKTTPRSLRHFPVKDENGKADAAHVRDALSRIPQSSVPDAAKSKAKAEAQRMLESINKSVWKGAEDAIVKLAAKRTKRTNIPMPVLNPIDGNDGTTSASTNNSHAAPGAPRDVR